MSLSYPFALLLAVTACTTLLSLRRPALRPVAAALAAYTALALLDVPGVPLWVRRVAFGCGGQ